MALREYQNVKVEREDGITFVILNRPEKRNAMSPALNTSASPMAPMEKPRSARPLRTGTRPPPACRGHLAPPPWARRRTWCSSSSR